MQSAILFIMKLQEEIKGIFRNEYHKGLVNILYTANVLSAKLQSEIQKSGLTPSQYNVLRLLRRYKDEDVNINFIKERMLDKSSDVSRIIDKLFARKLISRIENSKDRRSKSIKISKSGLDLLQKSDDIKKIEDNLLSFLSIDEIKRLNEILDEARKQE
jgi:DNA-binding MarR family transcriptional regulator